MSFKTISAVTWLVDMMVVSALLLATFHSLAGLCVVVAGSEL